MGKKDAYPSSSSYIHSSSRVYHILKIAVIFLKFKGSFLGVKSIFQWNVSSLDLTVLCVEGIVEDLWQDLSVHLNGKTWRENASRAPSDSQMTDVKDKCSTNITFAFKILVCASKIPVSVFKIQNFRVWKKIRLGILVLTCLELC
jgi:hypothetical protein